MWNWWSNAQSETFLKSAALWLAACSFNPRCKLALHRSFCKQTFILKPLLENHIKSKKHWSKVVAQFKRNAHSFDVLEYVPFWPLFSLCVFSLMFLKGPLILCMFNLLRIQIKIHTPYCELNHINRKYSTLLFPSPNSTLASCSLFNPYIKEKHCPLNKVRLFQNAVSF